MKLELVRDWMSRDVVTISPEALLSDAQQLMTAHQIRRLPVVENGRLTAILTANDIKSAITTDTRPHLTVSLVASPQPITVSPDNTIGHAAQTMLDNKISGLPVLDAQQNLVGIITESDIFRLVVHGWARAQDDPPAPFAHYGHK
jgi:acetoin utilization protein AcuB